MENQERRGLIVRAGRASAPGMRREFLIDRQHTRGEAGEWSASIQSHFADADLANASTATSVSLCLTPTNSCIFLDFACRCKSTVAQTALSLSGGSRHTPAIPLDSAGREFPRSVDTSLFLFLGLAASPPFDDEIYYWCWSRDLQLITTIILDGRVRSALRPRSSAILRFAGRAWSVLSSSASHCCRDP